MTISLAFNKKEGSDEVHEVTATVYHAVEAQTDNSPLITASGFNINPEAPQEHRIVALSWDLEQALDIEFGDAIYVITDEEEYKGIWYFEDRMNKRICNTIDFLVNTDTLNKFNCKIYKVNQ